MRQLLLVSVTLLSACSIRRHESKPSQVDTCQAAREYITTIEYLRDQKSFSLTEAQVRDVANKVSLGCTGASNRFIKVTNLLVKSGLQSQKSIETGIKYSSEDDRSLTTFMSIFKSSYLETLLDLDLKSSLKIANDLTHSFKGDKDLVEKEFNKMVKFCVDKKSLDLPLPGCANLAAEILKSADSYKFPIGSEFIDTYEYLTHPKKVNLPTFQAIKIAKDVIKFGPEAKNSFMNGYEYGVSKSGLALTTIDAIEFGKTMASRSMKDEKQKN